MHEKDKYDKRKEYEAHIAPAVKDLKLQCYAHKMPMFVTVAVANSETGTEYMSDMVMGATDIHLSKNQIMSLLLNLNGLDVEPPVRVKKAMQILQDYLALLKAGADEYQIDMVLKTDLPESMDELMNGGQIVFPDGVMGRKIVDHGLGADIVMPDEEETE